MAWPRAIAPWRLSLWHNALVHAQWPKPVATALKKEPRRSGASGGCTCFREGSKPNLGAVGGSSKQKHKFCIKFNSGRLAGLLAHARSARNGMNVLMNQDSRFRPKPRDQTQQIPP